MKMIVEVIGKVDQGYSNPYECLDEDGNSFIVKGLPRSSQISEWICANLATEFGLPVAEYELVEIPEELYDELSDDAQQALGCGLAFGSRKIQLTQWFEPKTMHSLATEEEKMNLFIFDYWVKNADRNEGNPNLLVSNGRIRVIDHNSAFDPKFSLDSVKNHLFYEHINRNMLTDLAFRADIESRFESILSGFRDIVGSLPDWWQYRDPPDNTSEVDMGLLSIESSLRRFNDNDFWFFV